MQRELIEYFRNEQTGPGLLLAEAPTGYGKTYQTVQAIYTYLKEGGSRRVLFVTTLLKNLPADDLRRAYERDGRGDQFAREVLVLRSAVDTVLDAVGRYEVPAAFQSDAYLSLETACRKYRRYHDQTGDAATELAGELYDSIRTELEPAFRRELESRLRRKFPEGAQVRRAAIRNRKEYQWIAAFYPAVFWTDYKVLLLSVKKLMARNISIVEPGFDCLSDRMMQGSIVCLDEFDATRTDILDSLIEQSVNLRADYLHLFVQVYKGIRMHQASRELTALREKYEAGRATAWRDLMDQAEAIYQDGALQYSMKTVGDALAKGRNFLFHDISYLTVLDAGRTHVRAVRSDEQAQVQVYFDTPEEYRAHREEPRLVLQTILRRIHVFLLRFQRYVYGWAEAYARQVNAGKRREEDLYPVTAAAESIFREYGLSPEQVRLMTAGLKEGTGTLHPLTAPDLSFYENGFRLFEFIDDDRHRTQTHLNYLQLQNTPEKVLLYLCRRARVVGLSATAGLPTVPGNYDLRYLREQLGERFSVLSVNTQKEIRREMERLWTPYRDGRIRVDLTVVDRQSLPWQQRLKEIFGVGADARLYEQRFTVMGLPEYQSQRYCNLFSAMKAFWQHSEIRAFLCLNQMLPAQGKRDLDEMLLRDALETLRMRFAPQGQGELAVLRSGKRFEQEKGELLQSLAAGERKIIFSSYQTLGAGQNLQYSVDTHTGLLCLNEDADPADSRMFHKDVDALYLGDITHVTVNLQDADHWQNSDLMRYCFQMECLYQNDEISRRTMQVLLKNGIGHFSGKREIDAAAQAQLKRCPSFSGRVTRDVVQAVGRMSRTFLKRPVVYLFTTTQVLQNLDADCLDGRLLAPEMETLVRARSALQAAGHPADRTHLEAERIATCGNAYLMRMLSVSWNTENMLLWKQLRQTVLCHPRADETLHRTDPVIRSYYLPISPAQSLYFYAQKGDFSEVRLAPGADQAAFAALLRREHFSAEPSEVSAEEARLPILLRYPGLREHFETQGWATDFGDGPYMMSPVLFQNIYKGALGEVAGAYILQQELGLRLQEIDDPSTFERFDFAGPDGLWFDFKHWKSGTRQDEEAVRRKTLDKLDAVGGRRAFLINLIADPAFRSSCTKDERLVEIPGLLLPDGTVNRQAMRYLGRYL